MSHGARTATMLERRKCVNTSMSAAASLRSSRVSLGACATDIPDAWLEYGNACAGVHLVDTQLCTAPSPTPLQRPPNARISGFVCGLRHTVASGCSSPRLLRHACAAH